MVGIILFLIFNNFISWEYEFFHDDEIDDNGTENPEEEEDRIIVYPDDDSEEDDIEEIEDKDIFYVGYNGDYNDIQSAINDASNGDTIYVASGIYNEHVTFSQA